MNTMPTAAALSQHPFTRDLAPAHVDRLAALARPRRCARDEVLFAEGGARRDFYLVVRGRIAIEMEIPGRFLRVETLSGGDAFGWSAVLPGATRHFQARALDEAELLALDGSELLAQCEADPAFGFELMRRMLDVVRHRLQSTRLQLADTYSPVARKAGI